jgi:hypothetical protein
LGEKNLWLEIGALSYRIYDNNYDCGSYELAQELQDVFGTFALFSNQEVERLKLQHGGKKFCRFGSVNVRPKEKMYLD